jgi:hypothetical protein
MLRLVNNAILCFCHRTKWAVTVFLPVALFSVTGTTAIIPNRVNALPEKKEETLRRIFNGHYTNEVELSNRTFQD